MGVPGELPELRAQADRRGLAVRLARTHEGAHSRAAGSKLDPDVAALLGEAEDIVNSAGFDILAEQDRRARRKLFRKNNNKKRKR